MPHRVHFHEQVYFGIIWIVSTASASLGAVLTVGETRWLAVTFVSCFTTSCFLSLIFKKPGDPIGVSVGRAGMALLAGILGSKACVIYYGISVTATDAVALAAVSSLICVISFIIGFAILKWAELNSDNLAKMVIRRILGSNQKDSK